MISLMDHDNFEKSRKAVIVTAFIVIMTQYLNIKIDDVNVFGVKLSVSRDEYLFFSKLLLVYFLYIFILHSYGRFKEFENEKLEFINKMISSSLSKSIADYTQERDDVLKNNSHFEEEIHAITLKINEKLHSLKNEARHVEESYLDSSFTKMLRWKFVSSIAVEIAPPILASAYVFIKVN